MKGFYIMKNFLVLLLAVAIGLPGLAVADEYSGRVADLEKQIGEMTRALESMQEEVAALKRQEARSAGTETGGPSSLRGDWTEMVTLSGQVRFRGYDLQNMWTFSDDLEWDSWNAFRAKGSLKATVEATDDVTAVLQLTNQTWGNGVTDKYGQELDNTGNKFFLDNAYVNVRSLFDLPVDLTVGRQNLIYGGGFVLFDGNSQFASSNLYFDGVKLAWHPAGGVTLDAFYMQDEENNRDNLSNDDILLTGLYLTAAETPVGKSELYFLNRTDESLGKDIWMLGGRVSGKLESGFDYAVEGAFQFGDALENVDQEALGAKIDVGYTFRETAMAPRLFGGFVYLGGDDPETGKNEGWDVFYGGWGGLYGDLMAWTYVNLPNRMNVLNTIYDHNRLSSTNLEVLFSNFQMLSLGAQAKLMKNLTGRASWGKLVFNETYPGVDDDFGDYYQATLKYTYNSQLGFSLYGALLDPGKAFSATGRDSATELYWETDYRF